MGLSARAVRGGDTGRRGASAPVSTTHVVASSVVGVGMAQRRHHVHWTVVREIGAAWLITLPISALAGAAAYLFLEGTDMETSTRVVSPRNPRRLGTLTAQIDIVQTVIGVLRAWCAGTGEEDTVGQLRSLLATEHETRRRLHTQVRSSFTTPSPRRTF